MGLFTKVSGLTAFALAGAAVAVVPSAAQAQATLTGPQTIPVPCSANALSAAITAANSQGEVILVLRGNCTYSITTPATAADGLPAITGNVTLLGSFGTVIQRSSSALFRILDVTSGGTLALRSVSVRNGKIASTGGAIVNAGTLTVDGGTFSGNTASNGGAIANSANGTATVTDAVLTANTTTGVGGGAIINFSDLTVSGTTMSRNRAPINGGAMNTQPGGTTELVSSTVVSNTSAGLGGGISNLGTTSLDHTHVQQNKGSAGGGIATGNTNVTLVSSVVSGNIPDNCNPLNTVPGCHN